MNVEPASAPYILMGSQALRADDGTVFVRNWHRTVQLSGQMANLALEMFPLVDGHRTLKDLATVLATSESVVGELVKRFCDMGIMKTGVPDSVETVQSRSETFFQAGGPFAHRRSVEIDDTRVLVVGSGPAASGVARQLGAFEMAKIWTCDSVEDLPLWNEQVDHIVFVEELMTYRDLLAVDRYAASMEVSWAAGWWEGSRVVVTHEISFGRSACMQCLIERQRVNYVTPEIDSKLEERLRNGQLTTAGMPRSASIPPTISALLSDLVVLRASSLIGGSTPKRAFQLAEFELTTWELNWSTVLRLPSCKHCSPGTLQPLAEWVA